MRSSSLANASKVRYFEKKMIAFLSMKESCSANTDLASSFLPKCKHVSHTFAYNVLAFICNMTISLSQTTYSCQWCLIRINIEYNMHSWILTVSSLKVIGTASPHNSPMRIKLETSDAIGCTCNIQNKWSCNINYVSLHAGLFINVRLQSWY